MKRNTSEKLKSSGLRYVRLEFVGFQPYVNGLLMPLWNLGEVVGFHPVGSTVSSATLFRFGVFVPDPSDMVPGDVYSPEVW